MPIFYALIARDVKILSEYTAHTGNFQQIIASLLPKLQPNRRRSFRNEQFNVHTYCSDGLIFLCLTDNAIKIESAYAFLDTVKDRFFRKYSMDQISKTITFGINFTEELKATMEDFNENPEPDKAKAVISELSDVKNTTADNLNKVLDRDIKINVVLAKSAAMKGISVSYKKTATNYKNTMRRRYICYSVVLFLVLAFLGWLIASFVCGFSFDKCGS